MNLHYYWTRGLTRTLLDDLELWNNAYRPAGGIFYLPLYQFIEFCHPEGQWARSLYESACKVPSSGCDLRVSSF